MGDSRGKRPEKGVGQGDFGTAGEAVLESNHRCLQAQPRGEAADQGADKQGNNDVHASHGQDQHDEDR